MNDCKSKICEHCCKVFQIIAPMTPRRRFCSKHCIDVSWQKRHGWRSKAEHELRIKSESFNDSWLKNHWQSCAVCKKEFITKVVFQKYCSKRCSRDKEYFIKIYGDKWRLMKVRYELIRNINMFREELANA